MNKNKLYININIINLLSCQLQKDLLKESILSFTMIFAYLVLLAT